MRMLFLGDIVGSCGRDAVVATVPKLRRELSLDYVVVNGENIAGRLRKPDGVICVLLSNRMQDKAVVYIRHTVPAGYKLTKGPVTPEKILAALAAKAK